MLDGARERSSSRTRKTFGLACGSDASSGSGTDHLVSRFERHLALGRTEREFLESLELRRYRLPAATDLLNGSSVMHPLSLVVSGWLRREMDLSDGQRYIGQVLLPGDLSGLIELGCAQPLGRLVSCTEVELVEFPRDTVGRIVSRAPRLTAVLLTLSALDQGRLVERTRTAARVDARFRVLRFLLEIRDRLNQGRTVPTDTLDMPLSQAEIGGYIGLTNVSVSKVMVGLEADGILRRGERTVHLLDPDRACSEAAHEARTDLPDTSWFPAGDHAD